MLSILGLGQCNAGSGITCFVLVSGYDTGEIFSSFHKFGSSLIRIYLLPMYLCVCGHVSFAGRAKMGLVRGALDVFYVLALLCSALHLSEVPCTWKQFRAAECSASIPCSLRNVHVCSGRSLLPDVTLLQIVSSSLFHPCPFAYVCLLCMLLFCLYRSCSYVMALK